MHMPEPGLLAFWVFAALAAWVQTLTGFALGFILLGSAGLLGLLPLPQVAAVTSVLVIVNTGLVLSRSAREANRRALGWLVIGAFPGLIAGFILLQFLAGGAVETLRLLLGIVVAGSALWLAWRPAVLAQPTSGPAFCVTGMVGGVLGGLFATSGAPVIWQMYRQPMTLPAVRTTLIAFFFVTQSMRLGLVAVTGGLNLGLMTAAAGAIPAVALGTIVARRFPPGIAPARIRQVALVLLLLSGLGMIATALPRL